MQRLLDRFGGFFPAAVALALPVVWLPFLFDQFILPRASIVIAGACLGTGLALLIARKPGLGALRWPLAAAAGAAVLAFAFSVNWPLSFAGSYTRYESLPIRLSYVGLLASAVWLLRTHLQRELAIAGFVLGSSIAALEALWQAYSHVAFRPDGNLGNANLLAALLVMAIPLAVHQALRAAAFIGAWAAAVVVMGAGLLVTTSRSGYYAVGVAFLVLAVMLIPRRFAAYVAGLATAGAAAVALLVLVVLYESPLRTLNGDPPELRLHLWADGLRMVEARPLTGWGEDATGLMFGHFLSADYATLVTFDRVHSGPLDVAATQGILGLAATGAVVAMVLVYAWRKRDQPGVAGLSAALAGYSVWVLFNFDWSPVTGPFWLLGGVLWSSVGAVRAAEPSSTSNTRLFRGAVMATAALALVLAAVLLAVFPLLADAWAIHGRPNLAVRVDPFQAYYHWVIGTLPELRRAADYGETEPGMYVLLGDAELARGDKEAAKRAYRRALEIDPWYTPASDDLKALSG